MMRSIIIACMVLASAVLAIDTRAWTMVENPGRNASWFATWPGARGVMQIDATHATTTIRELISGIDRITGLAVHRDTELGTEDLLVYATAFDQQSVTRYHIDHVTGNIRGQITMMAPAVPRGLALDADKICISGCLSKTDLTRVIQCYRITRALARDGVNINEWWVLMSNYQWNARSNPDVPTADSILFDSQSAPTDVARGGSLWIDDKTSGYLVRFAVDSATGMHFPVLVPLPSATPADRIAWSTSASTQLLVGVQSVYELSWSVASGIPRIALDASHNNDEAVVVWRSAVLDGISRVMLSTIPGHVVTIHNAVSASPTSAPTHTSSPSASVSPSTSAQPTASPSATPQPSLVLEIKTPKHQSSDARGLWGLTGLVLPLCCVPLVVVVMWVNRRRITQSAFVSHARVHLGIGRNDLKSMPLGYEAGEVYRGGWMPLYDETVARSVQIPQSAPNSPFNLGDHER